MSTRLYLAGPMTGIEQHNFPLFNAEAARLRALGYDIVNPAEIGDEDPNAVRTPAEQLLHWRKCMKEDLREMLTCDGVALLPGWEKSKGASLEYYNANALGMLIVLAAFLVAPAERAAA